MTPDIERLAKEAGPSFIMDIKFGSVEPQLRYVPIPNGLKSQSRRIERDLNGSIILITEWEDLGTSITLEDSPESVGRFRRLIDAILAKFALSNKEEK